LIVVLHLANTPCTPPKPLNTRHEKVPRPPTRHTICHSDHRYELTQTAGTAGGCTSAVVACDHVPLSCTRINRGVQHNLFGKVSKGTVAKLPSNSFSVLARVFVPYSRLKIGNRGNTSPNKGTHFAVEDGG
jgi:hypothetical protein